ncbi:MAG: hypothetical protein DBX39_01000 [Bacillota bacterium]|nr:MAG: hypothetical protein DBX39_01000 [Bacillota bacterium]
MSSILAVFRSRAQTLDYVMRLKSNGINAAAVSTPREANVGCGLSAKIGTYDLARARNVLAYCNRSAFVGFFRVENNCGRTYVYPV